MLRVGVFFFSGQSDDTASSATKTKMPPRPVFDPQLIYDKETSENELVEILKVDPNKMKMKHKVKIGVLNLLQVKSP